MNGLASSFLVTAWNIAPETARHIPASTATITRGIRMFHTMSVRFGSSGSSAPKKNDCHA